MLKLYTSPIFLIIPYLCCIFKLMYRIKEIAKKRKCNIKDIAESIGIAPNSLSRIINGENTTVDTLERIAESLNVDVGELFVSKKEMKTIHVIIDKELNVFYSLEDFKEFAKEL